MRKLVLLHLPGIVAALFAIAFAADIPFLAPLKTERTYGWWVVVGVPMALILILVQVAIWARMVTERARA